MTYFLQIHPQDNVAVALQDVPAGTQWQSITTAEFIPQGHKVALLDLSASDKVIKYGFPIGHATCNISAGCWVHTHNMATDLSEECDYRYEPAISVLPSLSADAFMGYRRKDGKVGIRNEIWILPTVGCVNDIAQLLVQKNQHLVNGSIDGLYAFPHPFGCSQTGSDHAQTRRLLAALAKHPNAGAVLVLSLGCENLTKEQFLQELGEFDPERIKFLTCQNVEDELAAGSALLGECASFASQFHREELPASDLIIGMKCGGSDGLSGITANPLVGKLCDLVTAQGGSAILTEVPEMFGAEKLLLNRCINSDVFEKAVAMIENFKHYFTSHNEVVYENPSPGNKQGGITTLEDKSCGCVQKGGCSPIVDVIDYGTPILQKGLNLLNGPGNDLVSTTALTAAGAHLILFTTGRGTPFGAPVPTVKIATNTPLAQKKKNWIDFNAGVIADGKSTIPQSADRLMKQILSIASGAQTKNEQNGCREIAIFKDGVTL